MQYGFLTKEWIYAATKAIEDAKRIMANLHH